MSLLTQANRRQKAGRLSRVTRQSLGDRRGLRRVARWSGVDRLETLGNRKGREATAGRLRGVENRLAEPCIRLFGVENRPLAPAFRLFGVEKTPRSTSRRTLKSRSAVSGRLPGDSSESRGLSPGICRATGVVDPAELVRRLHVPREKKRWNASQLLFTYRDPLEAYREPMMRSIGRRRRMPCRTPSRDAEFWVLLTSSRGAA